MTNIVDKILGRQEPAAVGAEEKIVQYDKEHLKDFRDMQAAEGLLQQANTKGFRKPSNKEIARAKETVLNYRRIKAETFLEEHKSRVKYYGVEIKAYFEQLPNGLIKPSLTIADYNPFREIAAMKPWSESMEENLATRINCTHEMNDDDTACKKCGLNPENWGSNGEGVSNDYQDKQRAKIEAEKAKEIACKNGDHVLNEEAANDPAHKTRICVNCRLPESEWTKPEVEETGGQSE